MAPSNACKYSFQNKSRKIYIIHKQKCGANINVKPGDIIVICRSIRGNTIFWLFIFYDQSICASGS